MDSGRDLVYTVTIVFKIIFESENKSFQKNIVLKKFDLRNFLSDNLAPGRSFCFFSFFFFYFFFFIYFNNSIRKRNARLIISEKCIQRNS